MTHPGSVAHAGLTAARASAQLGQVELVVNTHWHSDHVGGNARMQSAGAGIAGSLPDSEAVNRRDPGWCVAEYLDQLAGARLDYAHDHRSKARGRTADRALRTSTARTPPRREALVRPAIKGAGHETSTATEISRGCRGRPFATVHRRSGERAGGGAVADVGDGWRRAGLGARRRWVLWTGVGRACVAGARIGGWPPWPGLRRDGGA